ncbi:hypothetical protein GCM10018952_68310 [Streptosporangium vulgare]
MEPCLIQERLSPAIGWNSSWEASDTNRRCRVSDWSNPASGALQPVQQVAGGQGEMR